MKIDGKEWRLVPVEATQEMLRQFSIASAKRKYDYRDTGQRQGEGHEAMLAASPAPDIEEMVEGVKIVIEENAFEPPSATARAVLKHLFGEG